MNSRTTLWLVGLALGLLAFISLIETQWRKARQQGHQLPRLLPNFNAADVTIIEVIRSNRVIRIERKNDAWTLTAPLVYPAQPTRVDRLLTLVAALRRVPVLSAAEQVARPRATAEFGIDPPQATLVLRHKDEHVDQLLLGAKSIMGDQVYFQLVGVPGIFLAEAGISERLPVTANDWRDTTFLGLKGLDFNRVEVKAGQFSYEAQRDPANQLWQLTKPPPAARADPARLNLLLQQLQETQISRFETDQPTPDLESYGLQPPELELIFGQGTNDLRLVQFGKSPPQEPTLVYARRPEQTNIVLVTKEIYDLLRVPAATYRDRRLAVFSPAEVDVIEVRGAEKFILQRSATNAWRILAPVEVPADAALVEEFLSNLEALRIEKFVNDVVTDFSAYGLATATRQFILKSSRAKSEAPTNQILAQIDLGATLGPAQVDLIYARRLEDDSVYAVSVGDSDQLPQAWFQLRERSIWNFASSNVVSVTVTQAGRTRKLLRNAEGEWSLAPLYQGTVNPFAPEATVQGLSRLRAEGWILRTNQQPAAWLGFKDVAHQVAIEVKSGDTRQVYAVEFGRFGRRGLVQAATRLEGEWMVFEFPKRLYEEVLRDFTVPRP